ncbi:MAG TPA: protein kinase [Vicinamibacterales bacterium]|nr:protein kinase [Vicinamibacterales bacterium]
MTPQDEETPIADVETRLGGSDAPSGKSASHVSSSSGWLSTSDAIDHGRFPPGTVLGGRYRIVGRLGRGGMGEVYRADDLKLAQPVALKFLPPELDRDPSRLMQLHNEVRMARQVSHPNVCRVYDIDEVDGHTFLSMEYVDGEELASLLRRIGRFSIERSLELAREICAGLGAAHERGVVHRDLKPANVMIDGTGRVRITDFGLAGVAGESLRAGTPAYMAPEQLAGAEVTARSDIYALGLVLYELFTGQRAIEARNVAELLRKREAGIVPPSQLVRDLDPAIDRAIFRCLEHDPRDRPASALAVSAALPGGDPLAAALAAGETPSPEMVAAAGETSALAPRTAILGLVVTLLFSAADAALTESALITSRLPLEKSPDVLEDRAREVARSLGYTEHPVDTANGFESARDYLRYAVEKGEGGAVRDRLRTGRPPGVLFWYRSSPRQMVPTGGNANVTTTDPPFTVTNMRTIVLDSEGRLVEFHAVPPQLDESTGTPPPAALAPNWATAFELAGLNQSDFQPATPQWTPRSYADQRAAWEGPMPGWPEQKLRLEAAAYRGRIVSFQSVNPWTQPSQMRETPRSRAQRWSQGVVAVMVIFVLAVAAGVARHNLRKGRGDRRGAFKISATVLFAMFGYWVVRAVHFSNPDVELDRLFDALGFALFCAGALWVLYLALEPYVRKFWPTTVISWSRLLAGGVVDPQVGRDVLIGVFVAVSVVLLSRIDYHIRPLLGYPALPPLGSNLDMLSGLRPLLALFGVVVFNSMFNSLWIIFALVAVNLLVRRVWITAVVMVGFLMLTGIGSNDFTPPIWLSALTSLIILSSIVYVMLRYGLLTTLAFFAVNILLQSGVFTLDPSRWFFPASTTLLLIVAALAFYGFYASRGGEPLLGKRILD